MKKLLFLLISIPLILYSCRKEKNTLPPPCLCGNTTSNISSNNTILSYSPNCFTPNNDFHNDLFRVIISDGVNRLPYTLSVNGIQLYIDTVNNVYNNSGWDGGNSPDGDYPYQISCNYNGSSYQMNGIVSLVSDINNLSVNFNCYPQGLTNCTFEDMIDPQYGFIYQTQEDIINW